jgi:hypothetical protein
MEKLTIKELAPYLPYRLNFVSQSGRSQGGIGLNGCCTYKLNSRVQISSDTFLRQYKPVLRPLSDLLKPEYINIFWQKDSFADEITESDNQLYHAENFVSRFKITDNDYCYPYDFFSNLFKYHFDVFGLIEKGFAIDITTLETTNKV